MGKRVYPKLTAKQKELLQLVDRGKSNSDIARILNIKSPTTVHNLLAGIANKMFASTPKEAVKNAKEDGQLK